MGPFMHNPVHNCTIVLTIGLFVLWDVKLLISRPFYTLNIEWVQILLEMWLSTIMHNRTFVITTCLFILWIEKLLISRPLLLLSRPLYIN